MNESDLTSINVLVVDDEPLARRRVEKTLETMGVGCVVTADSGEAALSALAAAEAPFHIVISDIKMPGMDGYELVRKIRYGAVPNYQTVPILMLTGQNTDKNIQSAQIHKISGYVVKSDSHTFLRAAILNALGLKGRLTPPPSGNP